LEQLPKDILEFKEAVTNYLSSSKEATTKQITDNLNRTRNRAVVENSLLRLFFLDELQMAKKGRAKIWRLNHVRINSKTKPIATVRIPVYENEKNVKNFWISLYKSETDGDYLYINETVTDGKAWVPKGAVILPVDMVAEYVFNILKVAMRSEQFKRENPELMQRIEDFTMGLSLNIGLTVG
jgi:hypothetical protein